MKEGESGLLQKTTLLVTIVTAVIPEVVLSTVFRLLVHLTQSLFVFLITGPDPLLCILADLFSLVIPKFEYSSLVTSISIDLTSLSV